MMAMTLMRNMICELLQPEDDNVVEQRQSAFILMREFERKLYSHMFPN